jgi:hypothetical protein
VEATTKRLRGGGKGTQDYNAERERVLSKVARRAFAGTASLASQRNIAPPQPRIRSRLVGIGQRAKCGIPRHVGDVANRLQKQLGSTRGLHCLRKAGRIADARGNAAPCCGAGRVQEGYP